MSEINIKDLFAFPDHLLRYDEPKTVYLVAKTDILEALFDYANRPWMSSKEALEKMCSDFHTTLDRTSFQEAHDIVRKYKSSRSALEKSVDGLYDIFNPPLNTSDVNWNPTLDF